MGQRSTRPQGHTSFTRLALVHQFVFQPIVAGATASLAYNYMLLFNLPEMVYTGFLGGESFEKIDKVHNSFFHLSYALPVTTCVKNVPLGLFADTQ